MKSKKSIELALSTIAIAAVILGIVVVSIILLTGGFQRFSKTINSCEQNGGECVSATSCETSPLDFECPKPKICCTSRIGLT